MRPLYGRVRAALDHPSEADLDQLEADLTEHDARLDAARRHPLTTPARRAGLDAASVLVGLQLATVHLLRAGHHDEAHRTWDRMLDASRAANHP